MNGIESIAALRAERDALKQWYDQHEEREAACCPEDVGCIEFIGYLKDSLTAAESRAEALAEKVEVYRKAAHWASSCLHEAQNEMYDAGLRGNNACYMPVIRELDEANKTTAENSSFLILAARDARVRIEACVTGGVEAIAAERRRQIEMEGWTPAHDDEHRDGELARAAGCYAFVAAGLHSRPTIAWPWSAHWWKPRDTRSNLVRAGALIAAEIDRLDRKAALLNPAPEPQRPQAGEEK